MTDQNQHNDPNFQKQDDTQKQNSDIFGWSDDIFENSEILQPLDEKTWEIKEEKLQSQNNKFDISSVKNQIEENKEEKFGEPQTISEPDFENSPEIDALDDLEDLELLPQQEDKEETKIDNEKDFEDSFEGEEIDEYEENDVSEDENEQDSDFYKNNQNKMQDLSPNEKIDSWKSLEKTKKVEEKNTLNQEIQNEVDEIKKDVEDPKNLEDWEEENLSYEQHQWIQRDTWVEEVKWQSDLQKKLQELILETKNIHELVNKDLDKWFDLLWWNDDRTKVVYTIFVWNDFAKIDKNKTTKEDNSTDIHTLKFKIEPKEASLQIVVDEELLYDEFQDLEKNPGKKSQVLEKLNKFIFLVKEEYKKIEKEKKQKESRNKVKWIFRNFVF